MEHIVGCVWDVIVHVTFTYPRMRWSPSNLPALEYGIFGQESQISTNHNRESTVFALLIS